MAYDETLANRVREILVDVPNVEEKFMFGGVCFMVNDKMCMGVVKDDLMCRIDPNKEEEALEMTGCRQMDFTGRPMRGYLFIDAQGYKSKKNLEHWVTLSLEFNSKAKATKKKKK